MVFLNKYKRYFLLAGMAVCVVAIILTLRPGFKPTFVGKALSYVIGPLQRGATAAANWVGGKVRTFTEMEQLRAENETLRAQVGLLTIDNQRLQLADADNERLSALLEIDQMYAELPTMGARVVAKNPNDWFDSYHINRGTDDGLSRNMAVLGIGGLLGEIRAVYPTYSEVITIIDRRCAVAVQTVRTEDTGMLKGDMKLMSQGLCRMDYINAEAQIMPGDEVITSAYSTHFPPGILVGTVLRIEPDANGLTKHAIIQPAVQIKNVDVVSVVNQLYGDEDAVEEQPVFLED